MKLTCYPDPVLRLRSVAIEDFTPVVARRVKAMFKIMEEEGGIGLAAPQAGWSARVFVTRIPQGQVEGVRRVYVNPVILDAFGSEASEEGCLSFPEITGRIERHTEAFIRAQDLQGNVFEERGTGLAVRCWEHEIDHLDGILFTSRMTAGDLLQAKQALRELEEELQARPRRSRGSRPTC